MRARKKAKETSDFLIFHESHVNTITTESLFLHVARKDGNVEEDWRLAPIMEDQPEDVASVASGLKKIPKPAGQQAGQQAGRPELRPFVIPKGLTKVALRFFLARPV